MEIPKIIHSIAPADKSAWHECWDMCYQSWFVHFDSREFQFKMWDDEDSLDNFVSQYYPEFYKSFLNLPHKIMKIDISRLLILHMYGGIYHDMDYFLLKNFYSYISNLSKKLIYKKHNFLVAGSRNGISHEVASNFIMVSEKNCSMMYFIASMSLSMIDKIRETEFYSTILLNRNPNVSALTGPLMLSNILLSTMDSKNKDDLLHYILDVDLFNPDYKFDDRPFQCQPFKEQVFGKHMGSSVWI